jgi:hypothetical protein
MYSNATSFSLPVSLAEEVKVPLNETPKVFESASPIKLTVPPPSGLGNASLP